MIFIHYLAFAMYDMQLPAYIALPEAKRHIEDKDTTSPHLETRTWDK